MTLRCVTCGEAFTRSEFCRDCDHRPQDGRDTDGHESWHGIARINEAIEGTSHD